MITGEIANARVHLMRAHADAIMVGIGTVLADDPHARRPAAGARRSLARPGRHRQPPAHAPDVPRRRHRPAQSDLDRRGARAHRSRRRGRWSPPASRFCASMPTRQAASSCRMPCNCSARGASRGSSAKGGPALAEGLAQAGLVDELVLVTGRSAQRRGRHLRRRPGASRQNGRNAPHGRRAARIATSSCSGRKPRCSRASSPMSAGSARYPEGGPLRRLRIESAYDPATIALGASIACGGPCLTVVAVGPARRWMLVRRRRGGRDAGAHDGSPTGSRARGSISSARSRSATSSAAISSPAMWMALRPSSPARRSRPATTPGGRPRGSTSRCPPQLAKFIAEKGSVCLDGTSLTVNTVDGDVFSVLIIPHTLAVTTWGERQAGDKINIEVDLMARYAARLAEAGSAG